MKNHPIILNMVACKGCKQVLISRSVHHFLQCSCPNKTICDGGNEYLRRGGMDMDLIEELSIVKVGETLRKATEPEA